MPSRKPINEAAKCIPPAEAVIDRSVVSLILESLALFVQPRLQFDYQRAATLLTHAQALLGSKTVDVSFDGE
ncbi:hypothetical protein [Bradyrhizobium sp. CW10]|uniref:hypothetical protein n=1 Tax=Bradyrhizobium sp. CW10 TaxID=2782683 RepID=UPI001FFB6277|nr:hypothetical protein [Bradyrhizobium sp. CW10]MCK1467190.1 hypothetical protein [Bradyrhizobium sp. CW10]